MAQLVRTYLIVLHLILYHSCCNLPPWPSANQCKMQDRATFASNSFVTMECVKRVWFNNYWRGGVVLGDVFFSKQDFCLEKIVPSSTSLQNLSLCWDFGHVVQWPENFGRAIIPGSLVWTGGWGVWEGADKICGISTNCTSPVIASSSPY